MVYLSHWMATAVLYELKKVVYVAQGKFCDFCPMQDVDKAGRDFTVDSIGQLP
jgi:hypothetical protein